MKKIYTLVGSALIASTAVAQAPYAVNGQYQFSTNTTKHAPNGITFIDMRDAQNNNQDRIDYYTEDFDGGFNGWVAAIQNGPVGFEITNVGHANDAGSTFVIPALLTSTPTNWVLLDSDSDGTSGQQEDATLTSPVIDLTTMGLPGTGPYQLKLEFEQFYAGWQSDTLFLAISDDGGANWDEVEIMNNSVGRENRPNPEIVSVNISPYVVDASQVRIRMRWTGNWDYGWQFDNIKISDLPDNDMRVVNVFRGDLINSFMYSQVPQDQVVPFVIGADVENIGFLDQTNVAIQWEIWDPSLVSMGSGTSTATIANLANGENDTIWITTGITPAALGNYTIDFTVIADNADDEPANNAMTDDYFWVTDWTYAADYGTPNSAFYNWANNNDGACSIGNIFVIENDGVIGAVTAELDNNVAVEDQLIYYQIYTFDGTTYTYQDQTDDYTTTTADNGQLVTLYFDPPFPVVAGDAVLALASHYGGSPSAGFEMAGRVAQGAVAGTDETAALVSLIDPSAPVVRILMNDFTSTEEMTKVERFDVYPNPATDAIFVKLTLTKSTGTVINVLDITGQVIKTVNVGDVNGDQNVTISLDEMSTGIYFIELVNADGRQVKKFVKK
jgi:hypothetical protein